MPDPSNAKEYYNFYLKRKNKITSKRSKIITYQLKATKNPNIIDLKSVIIEHPKPPHKLSKTIIAFYTVKQKKWKFFEQKNIKITKLSHASKVMQVFVILWNIDFF